MFRITASHMRGGDDHARRRPVTWAMAALGAACLLTRPAGALEGQPGLHDPSTVIVENDKYYVYATGNGLPMSMSDDGWT